jgi:hypothetical protein
VQLRRLPLDDELVDVPIVLAEEQVDARIGAVAAAAVRSKFR